VATKRSATAAGRQRSSGLAALVVFCAVVPVFAQDAAPAEPALGLLQEPTPITRVVSLAERRTAGPLRPSPPDGLFVDMGNMIIGSGWISAGPGYRKHVWNGRALVTTSAGLSWRLYSMAQARIDVADLARGRASIGAQALYQDSLQVNYFGLGNRSSVTDRSGFRLRTIDVAGYGRWQAGMITATARAGALGYVDVSSMRGREPEYPNTEAQFTDQTAPGLSGQPGFVHADGSIALDTRDEVADPARGGVYRASIARYSDQSTGHYTFNLYEAEAEKYVSVIPDRLVIAGRAWTAMTSARAGNEVPFYLMPNAGGQNSMRGYSDYRFTDRQMETISLESRVRVYTHLDVAVFADAGKVAPRAGDLGLSGLHASYGVGVRLRDARTTFARFEIAKGAEGWHFLLRFSEPFKRKTLSGGRTTVAPFVP
jgi:hypothetical protein